MVNKFLCRAYNVGSVVELNSFICGQKYLCRAYNVGGVFFILLDKEKLLCYSGIWLLAQYKNKPSLETETMAMEFLFRLIYFNFGSEKRQF